MNIGYELSSFTIIIHYRHSPSLVIVCLIIFVKPKMSKDLININNDKIPNEVNPELERNALLYPAAKSFLEKYPQYNDVLTTYEDAMESIGEIIKHIQTIDTYIPVDGNLSVHFKLWMDNTRIYSPDSIESSELSNFGYVPTPNDAIVNRKQYSATMVSDIHYSYCIKQTNVTGKSYTDLFNTFSTVNDKITERSIPNGYVVNFPIPIGCKYCSLRNYDYKTLISSGHEMESLYGFFIIDGLHKYIIPIYKKPFNIPIVIKNVYDEQLARTEIIYTKSFDYENSFFIVGAMLMQKNITTQVSPPDFGFSLQLQHPKMISEASMEANNKKLINFVPIKFLFYAFGCTSDREMVSYICPSGDDVGLINAVRMACLQGYRHKEVLNKTQTKIKPLTPFIARYIIGMLVLNEATLKGLQIIATDESQEVNVESFKLLVVQTISAIFDERFMPGAGSLSDTNRNTVICIELGNIVRDLYNIGCGLEVSQDKASLTNRRIRHGAQISYEVKNFHGVRLREVLEQITPLFKERKNLQNIETILHNKLIELAKAISMNQSKSLVNAIKGTSKEQSNIRAEYMSFKNFPFMQNLERQIVISSSLKQKGATVSWEHRAVHQSELFFICPTQTPENGDQVGRFKTPALYTKITLGTIGKDEMNYLKKQPQYHQNVTINRNQLYAIKINGSIVGYVREYEDVEELYANLLMARRKQLINREASIVLNHRLGYLAIWTDGGRIISPFIVVRNVVKNINDSLVKNNDESSSVKSTSDKSSMKDTNESLMKNNGESSSVKSSQVKITSENSSMKNIGESSSMKDTNESLVMFKGGNSTIVFHDEFLNWLQDCSKKIYQFDNGLDNGFIEFLDPDMAVNNAVIAPTVKDFYAKPQMYTHIAFPNHIHGIIAALVPAINMNVAVRSSLSTNFTKQAIGSCIRYPQLKHVDVHLLVAPQIPLARTCTYDHLRIGEYPFGQNVIVAFLQAKYNQEDALILNGASVESGLLQIDSIKNVADEIMSKNEEYSLPNDKVTVNGNMLAYSKIDPLTSLPKNVGEVFYTNDPIIGKIRKTPSGDVDVSMLNDSLDGKYPPSANQRPIRCICRNRIMDENKQYKMAMFGQFRVPILGDKFNSEYAQKGTVGKILPVEDVPYTSTGIRPDIIFNPPAIIRRRTYGQIYIGILSKIAALLGCPIDTTQYHTLRTDEQLFDILRKMGLEDNGYETVYDPDTGKPFESRIFVCNHYWERQSHLTEEKISLRCFGPKVIETMQPTRGRKNAGGQAIDRMSFDSLTASGSFELLRDSFLNQGSKMKTGICKRCNYTLCYYHQLTHEWVCPRCGRHDEFIIKEVPPASVLLTHILTGCHIGLDYYDKTVDDK